MKNIYHAIDLRWRPVLRAFVALAICALAACVPELIEDQTQLKVLKGDLRFVFATGPKCAPRIGDTLTLWSQPATDSVTVVVAQTPFSYTVRGVAIGAYEVFAANRDSRVSSYVVVANDTTEIVDSLCVLVKNFPPVVTQVLPDPRAAAVSVFGDTVRIRFSVSDDRTPLSELRAVLGLYAEERRTVYRYRATLTIGADGIVDTAMVLPLATFFDGQILVIDDCDAEGSVDFGLNNAGIAPIVTTVAPVTAGRPLDAGLRVSWSVYRGPRFSAYEVQRSEDFGPTRRPTNWETIATISDSTTIAYVDPVLHFPITRGVRYRIIVGEHLVSDVASIEIERPGLYDERPSRLTGHPTERVAYGLLGKEFVRFDLATLGVTARSTIKASVSDFTTCEVATDPTGLTHVYLNVVGQGIYVLNATTLRQERFFPGDYAGGVAVFMPECFGVTYELNTDDFDPQLSGQYVTIDLATGREIARTSGLSALGTFRRVPGQRAAICITAGGPWGNLYFTFSGSGAITEVAIDIPQGNGGYYEDLIAMDPKGVFWVTGTAGSVVSASRSGAVQGTIIRRNERFGGLVVDARGEVIYAGTGYTINTRPRLVRAAYPSLIREADIPLEGFVFAMARGRDRIVAAVATMRSYDDFDRPPGPFLLQVVPTD